MAYIAPHIDSTGIHIPTYIDIRDSLIEDYKQIYGQDIYIDPDSQDYQFLSVIASKISDTNQLLEIIYNANNVKTAIGSSLDNIVKLNGLKRKEAGFSTVNLILTGTIGTVIRNGVVSDGTNLWILDDTELTLTSDETEASATCNVIGAIEAPANTITKIINVTRGWLAVNNPERATVGAPVETDAELRLRQSLSVAIPSLNMVESLYASIMALDNVQTCKIYDNDSHQIDINGIPPHSFACVVEGGNSAEIASVIYKKKGGGAGTYGTTTETVTTSTGLTADINFFRPTELSVDVRFSITRTNKFTSDTEDQIRKAIKDYFDNITIGADVLRSSIITVVSRVIEDIYEPDFRINLPIYTGVTGDTLLDRDTDVPFNQRAVLGNLTIIGGLGG